MTRVGRIAIIGTGQMGGALLSGIVRTGIVDRSRIFCTAATEQRCLAIRTEFRVEASRDNRRAVEESDTIVLAVKPSLLSVVLEEIGDALHERQTLISMLTGVSTNRVEALLPQGAPVTRSVTNLPASVGMGMSVISGGCNVTDEHMQIAEELLTSIGHVERLPEDLLDVVTATSGSGPAYLCYFLDAVIEAAVGLGVPRDVATTMMARTTLGTATLLLETQEDPVTLREAVTSPGGSTAAALQRFDDAGVRSALIEGVQANFRRAKELGHS